MKSGRYWDYVRADLRADLRSRGVSGSEWYWNNFQNAQKVIGLLVTLEWNGVWDFVGPISDVWFGPVVFGMKFKPKNKKAFLRSLRNNRRLIESSGSGGSKYHFRDMSSVNSLHLHGNGMWEAHIDTFHPYANPILHGLIDYLPGKLQNLFR